MENKTVVTVAAAAVGIVVTEIVTVLVVAKFSMYRKNRRNAKAAAQEQADYEAGLYNTAE
jgi:cytosine/uracil/thiamine/allantoin permease